MPTLRSSRFLRASLAGAAVVLFGACADSPLAPTAPGAAVPNAALGSSSSVATPAAGSIGDGILSCPTSVTQSATGVIGKKGGVVRVAGSELVVGPGAVKEPTAFTVVLPASPMMEIEIHAQGVDHYEFRHRVSVTMDYSRCAPSALPAASLAAWYIDSGTKGRIANMRAVDDRASRRLTFYTDHLSGYAAVYRNESE